PEQRLAHRDHPRDPRRHGVGPVRTRGLSVRHRVPTAPVVAPRCGRNDGADDLRPARLGHGLAGRSGPLPQRRGVSPRRVHVRAVPGGLDRGRVHLASPRGPGPGGSVRVHREQGRGTRPAVRTGSDPSSCPPVEPSLPSTNTFAHRSRLSTTHTTGPAISRESIRSMSPPCPGMNRPMSLTPRSRLNRDSMRSPADAANTTARPRTTPIHQSPSNMSVTHNAPATVHPTTEPPKPSQVLFGLITGAILCRPNRIPAK